MINMLNAEESTKAVLEGTYDFLFDGDYPQRLRALDEKELFRHVRQVLYGTLGNNPAYEYVQRAVWYEALKRIAPNNKLNALEVATGETVIIPEVMDKAFQPGSSYVSINENKRLSEGFRNNVKHMKLPIQLVEKNAARADMLYPPDSFHAVLFQHAVNDILQGIVCARHGINTIDADWFAILPDMAHYISEEYENGTLEQHVGTVFLAMLASLCKVLCKDGYMVMYHYTWLMDYDAGYNVDLYPNIIPITRKWIEGADLPLEEIQFDGFNPRRFMFLKKIR